MKKPNRSEYGYSKKTGWQDERDRDLYDAALLEWYNQPRKIGKTRIHPIHETWLPYVKYFIPTDPKKSQNEFCRWAGLSVSYVSNAKRKQITEYVEFKLSEWIEEFAKLEGNE